MNDSNEISDRKAPGFWFFTGDFERDMQILPLAAQGLWIRMMCWASDNEAHRGFLELPTGEPMTELDIAHRVGKPIKEVRAALEAMRRLGTFSEDARGCIFSRRMARDTHISEVRRIAALKRASVVDRAKDGKFAPANQPAKAQQKPSVSVPDSVPDSDTVNTTPTSSAAAKPEEPKKPPPPDVAEIKKNLRSFAEKPNPLKRANGKDNGAAEAMLKREMYLRDVAMKMLSTYPGADRLYGSPDGEVIGKCLALCRGYLIPEEEALHKALVAMATAHKQPRSSWMWFPSVIAQYLSRPMGAKEA